MIIMISFTISSIINIKIPISVYFVALAKSIIMPLKRFIKKLIFRKRNDAKKIDEGWI